jgi:hypothetical protein
MARILADAVYAENRRAGIIQFAKKGRLAGNVAPDAAS